MSHIFGIGTDLVSVPRIAKNLQQQKQRFIERILSPIEIENMPSEALLVGYVAKRFAAKEALLKAMGTGLADGFSFQHISVTNDKKGCPFIHCTDQVDAFFKQQAITSSHVSLADEQDHAIAFVILECHS